MIFGYEELKEYVKEDFEQFYEWGFNEDEILSAVLEEYEHGEGFCQVENICIHISLVLNYAEKAFNYRKIIERLKQLMAEIGENEMTSALGNEYEKYTADLDRILLMEAADGERKIYSRSKR